MLPYVVVVADPSWPFKDKLPGPKRGSAKHYKTKTSPIDDICLDDGFHEADVAKSAVLFLWRVSSMVEEAYRVARAWGFTPKTELVWIKTTASGKAHMGMGRILRGGHETCLVAARGDYIPLIESRSERTWFEAPSVDEDLLGSPMLFDAPVGPHSRKPDKFYEIVEALVPFGPYLELHARRRREGWTCQGDELPAP